MSLQKNNILKGIKLDKIEPNEIYDIDVKSM